MEMENINTRFGKHLKDLRRKKKITQEELAYLAELEYKYIQRLESKKPSSPTLNTLQKLTKAFNINLSKLLDFK
ncbi:helix-turn-helix domain-containing protein [bacterium]|nr:helix-turn-helix domain-containing protein [bacterium]